MSIRLYAPGTRKGNKFWVARISAAGVKRREISTGEGDEGRARKVAGGVERELSESRGPTKSIGALIDAYISARRPAKVDEGYLLKLKAHFGKRNRLAQVDAEEACRMLYPKRSAATWNRQVFSPLLAVFNHYDVPIKLKRPRVKPAQHRAVSREIRDTLINSAADPDLRCLLTIMFYTGARISEAVSLTWDRIDLHARKLKLAVTKTGEHGWRAMPEKLFLELANRPLETRIGRVTRWTTRAGPKKALAQLRKTTGIFFTPHMARHTFATLLVDGGASLVDVKDGGGWKSLRSVERYVADNVERVRKVVEKL